MTAQNDNNTDSIADYCENGELAELKEFEKAGGVFDSLMKLEVFGTSWHQVQEDMHRSLRNACVDPKANSRPGRYTSSAAWDDAPFKEEHLRSAATDQLGQEYNSTK